MNRIPTIQSKNTVFDPNLFNSNKSKNENFDNLVTKKVEVDKSKSVINNETINKLNQDNKIKVTNTNVNNAFSNSLNKSYFSNSTFNNDPFPNGENYKIDFSSISKDSNKINQSNVTPSIGTQSNKSQFNKSQSNSNSQNSIYSISSSSSEFQKSINDYTKKKLSYEKPIEKKEDSFNKLNNKSFSSYNKSLENKDKSLIEEEEIFEEYINDDDNSFENSQPNSQLIEQKQPLWNDNNLFKFIKEEQIKVRLNAINRFLNKMVMKEHYLNNQPDVIFPFYYFMTYFGKCYKSIPLEMNNLNYQLSSIPSDQIGKTFLETNLKSNLHTLIGPYPYVKKSNSKLKSLKVIPLSDISTKVNSPIFYCICSKDENLINKNGLVSYYHKQKYDGNTYIISKYTDRVTMRLYLLKCFDNNEDMVDFALFVLENLHFIKINSLYLSISNEVVVFDLYSFINNIFIHYSTNQNLLSYSKLSTENLRGKVNYTIDSMGILVNGNTLYDDTTIAYLFWLYRSSYCGIVYYDKSWLSKYLNIRTIKDSDIKQLAHYIKTPYGRNINIDTIDSKVFLNYNSIEGYYSYLDNLKTRFDEDLIIYFSNRSSNEKENILTYLYYLTKRYNFNKLYFYMIYPFIYSCLSGIDQMTPFFNFLYELKNLNEDEVILESLNYISTHPPLPSLQISKKDDCEHCLSIGQEPISIQLSEETLVEPIKKRNNSEIRVHSNKKKVRKEKMIKIVRAPIISNKDLKENDLPNNNLPNDNLPNETQVNIDGNNSI